MWKTVELADVCDLITCGVAKRPDYVETGIPFLSAKNVKKQKVIWDDYKHITPEAHRALTKHNKPEIGDVLYTRVGSFGEAAIVDKDVEFSIFVSLTLIKPKPILLNKFLIYYLNSPMGKSLAKKGVSSSGVGNLNVGVVRKFPIPLPPLAEQQRIVAKLDAAFAEIDKAIKLAEVKGVEVENLKMLLLSSMLNINDLHTVHLGDVCELATGGTPSRKKKEYFENGHIKWLVSGDINQREIFDCDGRITDEGLANSNAKYLPENSVLIALNGQGKTRGTVALLRTKATCNQSLVSIYPKSDLILDTKFLFYVLDGMYGKIRTMTGDSGNDRRGLNMPLIRGIEIPLPPLAEQNRIVTVLDAAFAETVTVINSIKTKSKKYHALKSQILSKELQPTKSEAA